MEVRVTYKNYKKYLSSKPDSVSRYVSLWDDSRLSPQAWASSCEGQLTCTAEGFPLVYVTIHNCELLPHSFHPYLPE